MEKKTWNDSSLTRPRKPSSAAENDGLEDGLQSRGRSFVAWKKSDEKKLDNFGLKQDTFIISSKIRIIRIDPICSYGFLPQFILRFA